MVKEVMCRRTPPVLDELLKNIKTHRIETSNDLNIAASLVKNYCYYPMGRIKLQRLLNEDGWTYGEMLTDLVKDVKRKDNIGTRKEVGFILLNESPARQSAKGIKADKDAKLLVVRVFAIEPWFDVNTAVTWVKFRLQNLLQERKQFVSSVWSVDEHDLPLQESLKKNGFKAVKSLTLPMDQFFKNGNEEEEVTRIIFNLEL